MNDKPPAELGFTFPAEWQSHAATWMGWPFDDDYWEGQLEAARQDYASLVSTIAGYETVRLICNDDDCEADARSHLGQNPANIHFVNFPVDDVWLRDSGPLFIRNPQGHIAISDWRFNAWGDKYRWEKDQHVPRYIAEKLGTFRFAVDVVMEGGALDINAQGICLTTRQCLLNPNRNPHLSQSDIETALKQQLGLQQIIWLNEGLEGDKTDGHIDTITRWASDSLIITSICEDKSDSNYAPMQENLTTLQLLRQTNDMPYGIVELPLPRKRLDLGDERLPLTYANFYIGNGFVVVPQYDDINDDIALNILRDTFPDHDVIGLPSLGIITGGGSFHCITQQQPSGAVLGKL